MEQKVIDDIEALFPALFIEAGSLNKTDTGWEVWITADFQNYELAEMEYDRNGEIQLKSW